MWNIFKTKSIMYLEDEKIENTHYSFKNELNHRKNLKKALKLVKKYNITKNIPFEKELYFRRTCIISDNDYLGNRCFIELDKNNILFIYERNCYQNTILVQMKLKHLLKLTLN